MVNIVILDFKKRLTILDLLPHTGDYEGMLSMGKLKKELIPDEVEKELSDYVEMAGQNGGMNVGWDDKKEPDHKDIVFDKYCRDVIESKLKELHKTKKLAEKHLDLYRLFVLGVSEEKKVKKAEEVKAPVPKAPLQSQTPEEVAKQLVIPQAPPSTD